MFFSWFYERIVKARSSKNINISKYTGIVCSKHAAYGDNNTLNMIKFLFVSKGLIFGVGVSQTCCYSTSGTTTDALLLTPDQQAGGLVKSNPLTESAAYQANGAALRSNCETTSLSGYFSARPLTVISSAETRVYSVKGTSLLD